jgi:hypothetical protein
MTRKPLYQLSNEELETITRSGSEQERRMARTILVNRQQQVHNPQAFGRKENS